MRNAPESPNLLEEFHAATRGDAPPTARTVRQRALRIVRAATITVVVVFLVLAWTTRSSDPNPITAIRQSAAFRTVRALLRSPSSRLIGERDGVIHVLLLGMGGIGHEGPLLADTILLASVRPMDGRVTLTSIPRDLLLPLPGDGFEKANAIHAYAQDRSRRGGEALRDALGRVLGIEIPYHVRVDFRGFVGLVDALGGVTVDVVRTLNDPHYPIAGKESAPWEERFEHLVIPAGRTRMDGATALKYVRSRSALGVEGSDFARAERQQRLLLAVRERVRERGGFAEPRTLLALLDAWRDHVATNLDPPELLRIATFVQDADAADIAYVVFSDNPARGELVAGRYDGAYVLRPHGGDYGVLRDRLQQALTSAPADDPAPPSARLTVEVWNGTAVDGFAAKTASQLGALGLSVRAVKNAPMRTVERTIIYYEQRSEVGGRRSDAERERAIQSIVEQLRTQLRADVSTTFPAIGSAPPPDILVVLGASSTQLPATGSQPASIPASRLQGNRTHTGSSRLQLAMDEHVQYPNSHWIENDQSPNPNAHGWNDQFPNPNVQ